MPTLLPSHNPAAVVPLLLPRPLTKLITHPLISFQPIIPPPPPHTHTRQLFLDADAEAMNREKTLRFMQRTALSPMIQQELDDLILASQRVSI